MTEPRERQVFEPDAVPRRRKKVSQRRITFTCCLKTAAALMAAAGFVVTVYILKIIIGGLPVILSAHSDLKHQEPLIGLEIPGFMVEPLVNKTAPFDILATVWLDVTTHLKNGGDLPEGIQVVHYKQHNNVSRSEAILYSDLLFQNATMSSRLHGSARIRVPIQPLYTQPLGPATLRGTFKVVPRSLPEGLSFNSSSSIYPSFLPIGPRSPASMLLKDQGRPQNDNATSLEEALEYSSISTNLLTLLSTKWRVNDTRPNLRVDYKVDPAMYDGSPANRAFTNAGDSSSRNIIHDDHRLMLPHVRTRSRVTMIKEERNLSFFEYSQRLLKAVTNLGVACRSFESSTTNTTSSGQCQRPFSDSLFESMLNFNTRKGLNRLYYAPFMTQQPSASAYRHHRTIPRNPPSTSSNNNTPKKLTREKGKKDDACFVPLLEVDESQQQFFVFDWDVLFSTQFHAHSVYVESLDHSYDPGVMEDWNEDGSDIRVKSGAGESSAWAFAGISTNDREHPKSKPIMFSMQVFVLLLADLVRFILDTLYWYTRTTTQGLSRKGQVFVLLSSGVRCLSLLRWNKEASWISGENFFDLIETLCTLAPAFLELMTFLRIELDMFRLTRRRTSKKERDSRRLDKRLGWIPSFAILGLFLILYRFSKHTYLHLIPGHGCQDSSTKVDDNHHLFQWDILEQLESALWDSGRLIQILFNSAAFTYAGSFKLAIYIKAASEIFCLALEHLEILSGWQATRPPLSLVDVTATMIFLASVGQAFIYPGIPQSLSDEEYDDL